MSVGYQIFMVFRGKTYRQNQVFSHFRLYVVLKRSKKEAAVEAASLKLLFLLNRDPYSALVICCSGITVSIPLDVSVAGELVVGIAGKPLCEDLCVS